MPIAQKFKALGAGNGFPFCLNKIDVSDRGDGEPFDYWVTLGGFKKTDEGSPSQAQIDLSLRNAMKLFWNINKLEGSVTDEEDTILVNPGDLTIANLDIDAEDYGSLTVNGSDFSNYPSSTFEPKDRVCSQNFVVEKNQGDAPFQSGLYFYLNMEPAVFRMYDGSTTDEDNFVGYGCGLVDAMSFAEEVEFRLSSIAQFIDDDEISQAEYVTLSGIDFVATAEASGGWKFTGPGAISNFDLVNLTVEDVYDLGGGDTITWRIKIDALEFYTYPQT
jgi:hypothetical protein